MSDDYISREAAKNYVIGRYDDQLGFITMEDIIDQLDYVPAADVRENAKARWIDMGDHLLCSGCGATHYGADKNFCPNCGADIREETA